MMPQRLIQAHAQAIEIPFLVHFSRVANLPSIIQHGLCPINRINEIGATPEINDQLRLDGYRDGTSLSIAFPNYRMFYALRQNNPDVEWVVLRIDPTVLWLKDCAFCQHNAADGRISCQPLEQLKTFQSFVGMFDEIDGLQSREQQRLRAYDPTDGQAEVLVFDVIEPNLIIAATFQNAATRDEHRGILGDRRVTVHPEGKGFFAARPYMRC